MNGKEPGITPRNNCALCGEPMPEGEEMFNYHGYSGPCPKQPTQPPKPSRVQDHKFVANECHQDGCHFLFLNPAKAALGQMLKLVEDGVLVRNIKDDGSITAFVEQSTRLANVLKQAQEALK
jgi:hypothetical protein